MRPGLQGDATWRYLRKGLFYCFRCRWQFLFQKDFAGFIQNAVERPAISQIQTDGELTCLEILASIRLHSANLLHCRSPFLCASSTSNIGSVSHPAETGLLISSGKCVRRTESPAKDARRE